MKITDSHIHDIGYDRYGLNPQNVGIFRNGFKEGQKNIESIQLLISDWQDQTFPDATIRSEFAHFGDEVLELGDAINAGEGIEEELADCLMLLFGMASRSGVNLFDAVEKKFEINKKRIWGVPDARGVVRHIDEQNRDDR